MFKSIISLSVIAAIASFAGVQAASPGTAALEVRQPYTNGEAFARGLPPLRPRHRGSRTWTAVKRAASPILRNRVLRFDDASFNDADGPIPQPYQGLNLDCNYGSCGYEQQAQYPQWTAHSGPNAMYFYAYGYPTFTSAAGGTILLKSLYCTQAAGATVQLIVTGSNGGRTLFTQNIACTPNGDTNDGSAPTFNSFDLPAVESLAFSASGDDGGWTFDDISLQYLA